MHIVKLGHAHVKAVDLIIVSESVLDTISYFYKMAGRVVAEDVNSPKNSTCTEAVTGKMSYHTEEFAVMPNKRA